MSGNGIGIGTTRGNDGEYAAISEVLMRSKPTWGRCIILVDPLPEKYNDGSSALIVPEAMRDELKSTMTGVILAIGRPQKNMESVTGMLTWADLPCVNDRVLFEANVQYGDYRRVVVVTQSSLLAVLEP